MKLNQYNYVHKKIRAMSYLLEQSTGLKLITNFDREFSQIQFLSNYSSITIDFEKDAIFIMMIKLTKEEKWLVEDILLYTRWLYTGNKYTQNRVTRL